MNLLSRPVEAKRASHGLCGRCQRWRRIKLGHLNWIEFVPRPFSQQPSPLLLQEALGGTSSHRAGFRCVHDLTVIEKRLEVVIRFLLRCFCLTRLIPNIRCTLRLLVTLLGADLSLRRLRLHLLVLRLLADNRSHLDVRQLFTCGHFVALLATEALEDLFLGQTNWLPLDVSARSGHSC